MSKMMKKYPEILIYKDQHPYKAVESVSEASKETFVPVNTIYNMILLKPKTKEEKKNGGRTSPDGWGFDFTCLPGD